MELKKFIAALDNRNEFDKLMETIKHLDNSSFLKSQDPLVMYNDYPVDGNHNFITIPSSLSYKVKECIRKILQERVNELEKEFEKL